MVTNSEKNIFEISTQRLESIYNTMSVGIFRIKMTATTVELLSINPAVCEIFKFDDYAEFLGHWSRDGVVDTVLPEDYYLVADGYINLWREDRNSSVVRYRVKNHGVTYLKVNNSVILRSDDELIVQQEIINVTDNYKLAEKTEEMLRQKELTENIYETVPVGIMRLYGDRTNEIIMINSSGIKLLGCTTKEELLARRPQGRLVETVFSSDAEKLINKTQKQLKNQWDSFTMECRVAQKDGSVKILSITTTLISPNDQRRIIQRIFHDITYQKRRERQIRDSYLNRLFEIITTDTKVAYVMFSAKTLVAEFVSPNVEKLIGVTADDIKNDILNINSTDESYETFVKRVESVKKNAPQSREIMRIHNKTGEERWFKETLYRIKLDKEEKILAVISDRTEELRVKQTLEDALENARIASRAKSDFLFDMSHDIRTPMTAISGLITLLKNDISDPEKTLVHLSQLEISSQHMLDLLNNILDISRIESGKTVLNSEPFDIRATVDEVKTVYITQAELKDIKVFESDKLSSTMYIGDALRLKKILLNILSNAVKYTQNGGSIWLSVASMGENANGYDNIRFVIKDSGIGMSEEFVTKLFLPFERETNSTTSGIVGTGLGMSIVKNLVDLMGGTVRVNSKLGEGTVFTVDIPLKPVEKLENAKVDPIDENKNLDIKGVKILLAEDNDINAGILMRLLELEGAICERVENGKAALQAFESSDIDKYDMILMDIQMPVMNGYDATKAIRSCTHPRAASIPIAAMTANAFAEDVENSKAAGMNGHISKPINMSALKATVSKLLK